MLAEEEDWLFNKQKTLHRISTVDEGEVPLGVSSYCVRWKRGSIIRQHSQDYFCGRGATWEVTIPFKIPHH